MRRLREEDKTRDKAREEERPEKKEQSRQTWVFKEAEMPSDVLFVTLLVCIIPDYLHSVHALQFQYYHMLSS